MAFRALEGRSQVGIDLAYPQIEAGVGADQGGRGRVGQGTIGGGGEAVSERGCAGGGVGIVCVSERDGIRGTARVERRRGRVVVDHRLRGGLGHHGGHHRRPIELEHQRVGVHGGHVVGQHDLERRVRPHRATVGVVVIHKGRLVRVGGEAQVINPLIVIGPTRPRAEPKVAGAKRQHQPGIDVGVGMKPIVINVQGGIRMQLDGHIHPDPRTQPRKRLCQHDSAIGADVDADLISRTIREGVELDGKPRASPIFSNRRKGQIRSKVETDAVGGIAAPHVGLELRGEPIDRVAVIQVIGNDETAVLTGHRRRQLQITAVGVAAAGDNRGVAIHRGAHREAGVKVGEETGGGRGKRHGQKRQNAGPTPPRRARAAVRPLGRAGRMDRQVRHQRQVSFHKGRDHMSMTWLLWGHEVHPTTHPA